MGRWGKPLYSKELAPLFFGGTIVGGILAPFALLSGRESRRRGLLASTLVLLGGPPLRLAMVGGGIGRGVGRERGEISGVAGSFKKKRAEDRKVDQVMC